MCTCFGLWGKPTQPQGEDANGKWTAIRGLCEALSGTFLLSDEVLDNDISHVVSIGVAIFVEAVNCTEDNLVAGNGPILAAQHLDKI